MKKTFFIQLVVLSLGCFFDGVVANTLGADELMRQGRQVYEARCSVCHKNKGQGMPPAFPALVGGKITTGPVRQHIEIVLNGKQNTAMVAFSKILNDVEIASVVTYERNAWGNNNKQKHGQKAGGLVQPWEVAKLRADIKR